MVWHSRSGCRTGRSTFLAFDYNAIVTGSVATVIREETGPTNLTLAQLQAASKALNCFIGTPKFVNAAAYDFRLLLNSPCRGKGTNVSA